MGWRRREAFLRIQLPVEHVVQFGDRVPTFLEHLEGLRPMQGSQIDLGWSFAFAVELLDAIYVICSERLIESHARRPADGRPKPRKHHVTAANRFFRRADVGPRLLEYPRVQHLRHLLTRFQTASECLIYEFHLGCPLLS